MFSKSGHAVIPLSGGAVAVATRVEISDPLQTVNPKVAVVAEPRPTALGHN